MLVLVKNCSRSTCDHVHCLKREQWSSVSTIKMCKNEDGVDEEDEVTMLYVGKCCFAKVKMFAGYDVDVLLFFNFLIL